MSDETLTGQFNENAINTDPRVAAGFDAHIDFDYRRVSQNLHISPSQMRQAVISVLAMMVQTTMPPAQTPPHEFLAVFGSRLTALVVKEHPGLLERFPDLRKAARRLGLIEENLQT